MVSRVTIGQHLFFWALFLCPSVVIQAQGYAISDLPNCIQSCASDAAKSSVCTLTDTSCICSKSAFATDMFTCADKGCNFGDQSSAHGIFAQICASAGTTTAAGTSSSSQAPAGTSSSTPTSASQPAKANSAAPSATSAPASASGAGASSGSTPTVTQVVVAGNTTPGTNPTSSSSSSTTVVVQTVVVDPSLSAAGKADIPFSQAGAMFLTLTFGWMAATGMLIRL